MFGNFIIRLFGAEGNFVIRLFGAAPFCLLATLVLLYGHLSEQRARRLVLSEGLTASAMVRGPSDLQYVTVNWTDDAGRQRSGTAWTRKGFTRPLKAGAATPQLNIKYVSENNIDPVILSEVAEREWANKFSIYACSAMSLIFSLMTIAVIREYSKIRRELQAAA